MPASAAGPSGRKAWLNGLAHRSCIVAKQAVWLEQRIRRGRPREAEQDMSTTPDEQEAAVATRGRRAGGREARRAMRSAPLAEDIRPVRAGLEGGRYKPLVESDL